jgi:hypothetical protein
MDEDQFEAEYKRSKPFGFGFADWESYYIDKESSLYEPTANLMCANIPVLICVGEDDVAMPLARARRTYQALLGRGFEKATFRVIGEEIHQYLRYDVFAIIDTWLRTDCRSTDFELTDQDLAIIEEYRKGGELASRVAELPWKNGDPAVLKECYAAAAQARTVGAETWFELGLKLLGADLPGEASEASEASRHATDPSFVISFASHAWMGVIADARGERNAAVDHYRAALEAYPGFPIQHDQWNLTIDRDWLNDRLQTPFEGLQK